MREVVEPHAFFEALGVRYAGPDRRPRHRSAWSRPSSAAAEFDGPIVVHVLTQKGQGYAPAEDDDEKSLHDAPVFDPVTGPPTGWSAPKGYTQAFSEALIEVAGERPEDRRHHRGHARARPGCCPSRPASPTGSSTSGSPSSTR